MVKTKAQHRRHGQSRPIAMGATRLALGDSSLSKMRNIGTMARAAKKNPAPRGYEARGPHVARVLQSTAPARELIEFQGMATERKKAARRRF